MKNIDAKIEYLKSIQRIIDRLSNASFLLKGWTITLATALITLAAKDSNLVFFVIAYFPTIFFWLLDSHYLKMERQYRVLFNENASLNKDLESFSIEKPEKKGKIRLFIGNVSFQKLKY